MEKSNGYVRFKFQNHTRPILFLLLFFGSSNMQSYAQEHPVLEVGVRLQKSVNLYYENGFTIQYTDERLLSGRLYMGLSYVSSRLGSAMGSNAVKQDNYLLSSTYFFRPNRSLQPFTRLNTGYFYADYEAEVFDDLPNETILLSPEAGISLTTSLPLKMGASVGYNLITGDGMDGPGTLFPLFVQISITWNLLSNKPSDEK